MKRALWAVTTLAATFTAGCPPGATTPPPPPPTPTFQMLQIPSPPNSWQPYFGSFPAEVLPTIGRGVRIWFNAPLGSSFGVTLRALDGAFTSLPENSGTPAPADAGYFQIVSAGVPDGGTLPVYIMYVRAPSTLADPNNFDVLIANESLRRDAADSPPMVVMLRHHKVFTVSVTVTGNGYVSSSPQGIQCGSGSFGTPLTNCTFDFGAPVQVSLVPTATDPNSTTFGAWGRACPPNVSVCQLTLDGSAALAVTASFVPSGTVVSSLCPHTAAPLAGLRWVDVPDCATGVTDQHPGIDHPARCDAMGFFCCEPGPSSVTAARCGGAGKILSDPDCRGDGPKAMLRQPGGCYVVDGPP
jgi:hypothetical protein